jgi:hypothetical protein
MVIEPLTHSHVFLGEEHEKSERKTWAVIWLCGAMMLLEIVGGSIFGSIALVADGMHMSTHAGALLLAALAYSYAANQLHPNSKFPIMHCFGFLARAHRQTDAARATNPARQTGEHCGGLDWANGRQ